jgi:hypothetical protein
MKKTCYYNVQVGSLDCMAPLNYGNTCKCTIENEKGCRDYLNAKENYGKGDA